MILSPLSTLHRVVRKSHFKFMMSIGESHHSTSEHVALTDEQVHVCCSELWLLAAAVLLFPYPPPPLKLLVPFSSEIFWCLLCVFVFTLTIKILSVAFFFFFNFLISNVD